LDVESALEIQRFKKVSLLAVAAGNGGRGEKVVRNAEGYLGLGEGCAGMSAGGNGYASQSKGKQK